MNLRENQWFLIRETITGTWSIWGKGEPTEKWCSCWDTQDTSSLPSSITNKKDRCQNTAVFSDAVFILGRLVETPGTPWYPSQLVLWLLLCVLQLGLWNIPSLCLSDCVKKILVFRKTICGSDCSCEIQCHVLTDTSWCQVSAELRDCPEFVHHLVFSKATEGEKA